MNCPVCDAKLRPVEKHGVEVDICPDCKGVWLDRGELDKIIEFANQGGPATVAPAAVTAPSTPVAPPVDQQPYRSHDDDDDDDDRRYRERPREGDERGRYDERGRPRKRGSWLGDIFESFGGGD